jgi:hypothetical protein
MKDKQAMDYTLHVDRPSEEVIPELVTSLERHGLRVMVTFDLQLARANQVDCHCPHHGTERCTCQYAVLLVYNQQQGSGTYRSITAMGRDGEVWLSLLRCTSPLEKSPTAPAEARVAHETPEENLLKLLLGLAGPSHTEMAEADELAAHPA